MGVPDVMGRARLSTPVVTAIDAAKIIGVRAGRRTDHRFIGVWPVVVRGRVFARSWTVSKDGWNAAFLEDPLGTLQVGQRRVRVRAVRVKGERLRDAIEDAYAAKYDTQASQKYVRGFRTPRRRETTLEFVPREGVTEARLADAEDGRARAAVRRR